MILPLICSLTACSVEILHDIEEPAANNVIASLQRTGIRARKVRVTHGSRTSYTVAVRRADAPRAWRLLREQNLPRPQQKGLGEIFGDVGLVPTSTQEQALLRHALAGEISRTLNAIDGVQQAHVHVVLPRHDPLSAPDSRRAEPRAAVLLTVTSKPRLSVDDVRRLVSGSVEGLNPDAVNVVISHAASDEPLSSGEVVVAVGPFRVAAGSRFGIAATLVSAVVLLVALAIGLLLLARRNRRLTRTLASAQSMPPRPNPESSLGLIERSIGSRHQR